MTTAADAVLRPHLDSDPGAPLITHYDVAAPSRVELSATTTANWAAKIAGLLRDEVGVLPGDRVICDLPAHWLTAGAVLGVWWAGAEIVTVGPASGAASADDAVAVITAADRLDRHPAHLETLVMTTHPMGLPVTAAGVDLPPGVADLAEACRIHPDAFTPSGAGPAALDGAPLEALADAAPGGQEIGPGARVLVAGRGPGDDAVGVIARVLASGASAVLVTGADTAASEVAATEVADIAATERTTATA